MKKFFVFSCILAVVLSVFLLNFEALRGYENVRLDTAECVEANASDALIRKYGFIMLEWEFEKTETSDPYRVSLYLAGTAENRTFVCNMDDGAVYALKDKILCVLTPAGETDADGENAQAMKAETIELSQAQYDAFMEVNRLHNPLLAPGECAKDSSAFIKDHGVNLVTDYPAGSGLVNISLDGLPPEAGRDFSATLVPDSGYYLPDRISILCHYTDSKGRAKTRSITSADEITMGTLLKSCLFKEKYYSETGYSYDRASGKVTVSGSQINGEIEIRAAANPFFRFMGSSYGFTGGHIRKSYIIDEETLEIVTFTIKYYERNEKGAEKNKGKIGNAYVVNDTYFVFKDAFKENFPQLYETLNRDMRSYQKAENTFDYNH